MNTQPIADNKRIRIIDAIRGIAILGILLMNVYVGGQYWEGAYFQNLISNYSSADFLSTIIVQGLFEGKMRALFCMLFGAGILLFLRNKEKQEVAGIRKLHFKRMFWLALFGLFNGYILLFQYDILFMYAIAGGLLIFLKNLRIRFKLLAMPLVILIGLVESNMDYQRERMYYFETRTETDNSALNAPQGGDQPKTNPTFEAEERLMKGGYVNVATAVYPKVFAAQTKEFIGRITDNIPLMLLGMALFQLGFFTNEWKKRQYKKMAIIGYLLGIPLVIYDWYFVLEVQNQETARMTMYENQAFDLSLLVYHLQRIALALAHVALIILIYQKGWFGSLFKRLEAVGQMALTNYLMQSIFLAGIFFGFGLGLFNELSYYQLYFVVIIIWVLQLWYSPIWLRHFRFGPFEWLWRSLTYWKKQKIKRVSARQQAV
ncbi:DUF418 domain-containing protein [Robiginitalea sp. SC105]|uniref:DUF418 domain-containing protein n=1 Tax=Robiginitalea sp. SC105 TaxID=2762332 RepID=UPI0016395B98|nr:DUF418 domain-containing protein [Robiginitalea sp. SC105]MBC2838158.1 DUF418 domain-containing protein [Robiginitalea sp. SC105]